VGEDKKKGCVVAGSSVDSVAITGEAERLAPSSIVYPKSPEEPKKGPARRGLFYVTPLGAYLLAALEFGRDPLHLPPHP